MSTTILKCGNANGTYLKVTNEQSTADSNQDKIFVSYDSQIELTEVFPLDNKNHYKVTLKEPENNEVNYFLYSLHWVVVSTDDVDIKANDPKLIVNIPLQQASKYSFFVQKQVDSLTKYSKTGSINLDTSCVYFSQRDNYTMANRTCNSSSSAMYLNWLQRASGQSNVLTNDDEYLRTVLQQGDTIYHENQTWALKQYGFNTVWDENGRYSKLKELVLAGFVVPINILHRGTKDNPRGGHIVCVIGYRQSDDWVLADPYGTFESGYTNPKGMCSFFSGSDMKARWQEGMRYLV